MTQISTLCPRVERCARAGWGPVSDRVENVKNGSASRVLVRSQERQWRAGGGGKLASAADEMSEWRRS